MTNFPEKINPTLYEDYLACKQTIQSSCLALNVISKPLLEKLKILQILIESSENIISSIEIPMEFQHLKSLDRSTSTRLYVDTVTCLFPRKGCQVKNYIRKGSIWMKSGALRNWKERLIILNVQQGNFSIYNDMSQDSLENEWDMSDINLEWVGFKKGKHCFSIHDLKARNPLAEILLGDAQFNNIREWYELMLEVKNTKEVKQIKSSFSRKKDIIRQLEGNEKALSDNDLDNDNEKDDDEEIIPKRPEVLFKKTETMDFFNDKELDELSTNMRTEEVKELIIPQIFHESLKNFELEKLLEEEDFNILSEKDTIRILQHNTKPTVFKVFFQINYPLINVCDDIFELKNAKHWNKTIEDIKVLNIIEEMEEQSYVIREIHKPYDKLYWPRDFCYLQCFVKYPNSLLTMKKSIFYAKEDKKFIRGNIKNYIEVFLQHPKTTDFTLGVLLIDIDNMGYFLTAKQNLKLSLKYLKQFKNLNSYFAHKNFLRSISNHISLYKIPIDSIKNSKSPSISKQPSIKTNNKINNEINPLFQSMESGSEPITPTLQAIEEKEKEKEKEREKERESNSLIINNNIAEMSFSNKKELNVIYEKSEESKSYDLSTDKVLEKDFDESSVKDSVALYYEFAPKIRKFPHLNRNDYVKLLEIIESNEHSIRAISKNYILHPVKTKEKFQSTYPEHYVFNKDWVKLKDGGLSYHNKRNLDNQKKVAGYLLRKVGKNLLTGKSIMSISMPIDIFDTESFLERIAFSFTHMPLFLEKAAKTTDILQQMNYICAGFMTTMHMTLDQIKPFNPILGETFQGWIKGCPIYLEQISHHPPISAFQLYGNGYILQGNFEVVAELHTNSLTGKELGLFEVYLKNQNRRFYFTSPTCDISGGFAFGTRYVNYEGKSVIFNKEQCLMMELQFNPDKKGFIENLFVKSTTPCDFFTGSTYKVTEDCMKRLLKCKPINKFLYYGINKKSEIVEEINKIRGVWHEYLMIDDKKYWDLKEHVAYELEYETDPLPSDSTYREDTNVWKSGNVEKGQMAKEKLEEIQRADRRWRTNLGPKKAGH